MDTYAQSNTCDYCSLPKTNPKNRTCSRTCATKLQWTDSNRLAAQTERMKGNSLSIGRPKGSKNKNPYPESGKIGKKPPSWKGKKHSPETIEKMSKSANLRIQRIGLPVQSYKGKFTPLNPEKYKGNPSNIIYRSSWELTCMKRFDSDKNIIEWQSEERSIVYRDPVRQKIRRYFPDFVIKVKNKKGEIKTYMIEVKPNSQTKPPKKSKNKQKLLKETITYATNQAKWRAAEIFCKKRGWEFKVLTEREIYGTK